MSRQVVRDLKRAVAAAEKRALPDFGYVLARESALALLARSIDFGHERLAVIRLSIAAQVGAEIPAAHWTYCERAVNRSGDLALRNLLFEAVQVSSGVSKANTINGSC
ncbi:MAG: hypothetical protein Q8R06_19100 [Polaromonas sp.]|uniref:hypothetical protein n=1 Tax=Polaromonas sp. TaxID=1869339 RepID=UPI0027361405|nr:hypothetical protein [Polaromonas sp.]MDP3799216.1 hypothetical protein [Polaromonas sp.]